MVPPHDASAIIQELRSLPAEIAWCEFKVDYNEPERIGLLIAAISNAACKAGERYGFVVWGIKDKTHEIVGTSFEYVGAKHKGQPLEFWLSQALQPTLPFAFCETELEGKRLVLLSIPAAVSVPSKFNHIAYIRIGSATPKLSEHPRIEEALLAALKPFVWEKGVAAGDLTEEQVLSLIDYERCFRLIKHELPSDPRDIIVKLAHYKLISHEIARRYSISNMGAMLFARNVDDFESVSRKKVRVIQYQGHSKVVTIKEQPGSRGYASGFDGLIKYIMNLLPQEEVVRGGLRQIEQSYPEIMIRESVANALVHQDFTITGCGPMVEIFKGRVEVSNPGRPLIEPSRFIDMAPRSRNEATATLMSRVYICEDRGTGVDKIVSAAESHHLPAPEFRNDGDNSKTYLYGPRPFRETSSTERVRACYHHCVMCFIRQERMSNASLRARLGLDESQSPQVSRIIAEAQAQQLIKQSDGWSARSGSYVPFWA